MSEPSCCGPAKPGLDVDPTTVAGCGCSLVVATAEPERTFPPAMLARRMPEPEGLPLVAARPRFDLDEIARLRPITVPVPDRLVEAGTREPSPDIWVDFDKLENGNGTQGNPFNQWAPVVDLLPAAGSGLPGPIVFVAGTAKQTLALNQRGGIAGAPIRIVLWPGRTFEIDGGRLADSSQWPVLIGTNPVQSGFWLVHCDYITIDGVDASSFLIEKIGGPGILTVSTSHITVRNVTIQWVSNSGMHFSNPPYPACAARDLLVERCRLDHTNLGRYSTPPTTACTINTASETITIENYDGFEVRCNHLSNSMMEGIDFKFGSRHGRVHHNLIEFMRSVGIYCNEGQLTDIYQNVVRYIGWHTVVTPAGSSYVPAANYYNTQFPVCRYRAGGVGILVSNGDLGCKGETGTVANIRVYQNEIYWTASSSISVSNVWRFGGVAASCWIPKPPDDGRVFNIEVINNVCYKAMQGKDPSFGTPQAAGFGAIEVDEQALATRVKNNIIAETYPLARASIAIVGPDPTANWQQGITIQNNGFYNTSADPPPNGSPPSAQGLPFRDLAIQPFVTIPSKLGEVGDFHLVPTSDARQFGTSAVYSPPGYQPGNPSSWNVRVAPDIGAHWQANDWAAGTTCAGLACNSDPDRASSSTKSVKSTVRALSMAVVTAIVLFISPLAGQLAWTRPSAPLAPPGRYSASMAFDASRKVTVLFGGSTLTTGLADTWEWDGTAWVQRAPVLSPSVRAAAAAMYDPKRQRVVLFGGGIGNGARSAETWEWDGTNWFLAATTGPPARSRHEVAYDLRRGRVALFGGDSSTVIFNDLWEWDGTSWTQILTTNGPPGKYRFGMAYDSARQRLIVFGGDEANRGFTNDTWEWDGTSWTQMQPATRPPGRIDMGMAYDAQRNRTVLFGGWYINRAGENVYLNDTWDWDGTNWTQRFPVGSAPSPRGGHSMVYDSERGRMVTFGDIPFLAADTWELYPQYPASYTPFGSACPGTAGTPTLSTLPYQLPWLGDSLTLTLTSLPANQPAALLLGASNTIWGSVNLPFDLTVLGMPGCSMLASGELVTPLTNTAGTASTTLMIPAATTLLGQSFYNQGFVLDPGANALGVITSHGAQGTVGGR